MCDKYSGVDMVLFLTIRFIIWQMSQIYLKMGGNGRVLNERWASPFIFLPNQLYLNRTILSKKKHNQTHDTI